MKKIFCSFLCLVFILSIAQVASARARRERSGDDTGVSADTTTASTVSQPASAGTSSAENSQPASSASSPKKKEAAKKKSKKQTEKNKRGPRSIAKSKASEPAAAAAPAVAVPSASPSAENASVATQPSGVSADAEAQAKADALKRAEEKMKTSQAVSTQTDAQAKMQAETVAKARADEDARMRAEAEAKAAEAATAAAAAAAKAQPARVSLAPVVSKGGFAPFYVYKDQGARGNHYIPSGWMGDYGDLKINPGCIVKVHSGTTSVQIRYSAKMMQNAGWCGIYWQNPPNNWGDKKGGFNLTGAKKLTFWACGEKGGEVISEFKMGGISGEFPDSDSASIGPIELSKRWQQYTIDLTGKDLTNIIGGFCFSASRDDNSEGFTIYLDDMVYE